VIYLFLGLAVIFIANIFIFLKVIKAGKLTSKLVNPLVVSFGIILFILPFLPQPRFSLNRGATIALTLASILLAALGFYLIGGAFITYRRYSIPLTPHNWTPPKIIDKGVYRIVRHPQFLGGLLAYGGLYLFMRGLFALGIIYPLLVLTLYIRAYGEERYILRKKFPQEYSSYQKRVGMLIPKFWHSRNSKSIR